MNSEFIGGHYYNKHISKNPLIRIIVNNFYRDLNRMVNSIAVNKVLDVGCGEGHIIEYLRKQNNKLEIQGLDPSAKILNIAKQLNPKIKFSQGNIYNLNCKDSSFDLALCLEVLEHLKYPKRAIKELKRVSKKYCIISVPNEPFWRIANILRLAYLTRLGNTPGHIQNWTKNQFKNLLNKEFKKVSIKTSTLWSIALCED